MSSASPQLLIETDILAEYLVAPAESVSLLRQALQIAVCYTTMLNALELFRAAHTDYERAQVLKLLNVVRVLGFHARFAEPFALLSHDLHASNSIAISDREAMILGMARASKIQIFTTAFFDRYHLILSGSPGVVSVLNTLTELASNPAGPVPNAASLTD